jgi:hypothetical protein
MFDSLSRLKKSELTVWILLLAGYAHLWLGVVSSIHQARLVRSDLSDWVVVCTQFGLRQTQLPSDPEKRSKTIQVVGCPICAVASMPAAPSLPIQPTVFRQETLVYRVADAEPVTNPAAPPVLRPPTRAPPLVS